MTVGLVTAALLAASVSIAVEPSAPADVEQIVASSCSSVFGAQEPPACRIESVNRQEDSIRVQVHWTAGSGGALRAKIIVFSAQRTREATRELSFDSSSRVEERWEAIGLVIAALANAELLSSERRRLPSEKPETQPLSESAPPASQSSAAQAEESAQLYLDVAAAFQSGSSGSLALGGSLRASLDLGISVRPELGFAVLVGSNPTDQMNLQPRWGMQLLFLKEPVVVGLYADAMMSVTRWSAERENQRETSWSIRYGGAVGGIFASPLASWMGVSVRGGIHLLVPSLEVLVEDQLVGEITPAAGEAELGFWFKF